MISLKYGDKVAIVRCSDPLKETCSEECGLLSRTLGSMGLPAIFSSLLYDPKATGRDRAMEMMAAYRNPEVKAIFDISGGNMAHEVIPYLDMDLIACNPKPIFGYSDLTCVINSVFAKTGIHQALFQTRHIVQDNTGKQARRFCEFLSGDVELFSPKWRTIQGEAVSGQVIGGNIRCFLKMAGTEFMPDFSGKLLVLESLSGDKGKIENFLSELDELGAFDKIRGLLLGTFTQLDRDIGREQAVEFVVDKISKPDLPIAVTEEIGHGIGAKALEIGQIISTGG